MCRCRIWSLAQFWFMPMQQALCLILIQAIFGTEVLKYTHQLDPTPFTLAFCVFILDRFRYQNRVISNACMELPDAHSEAPKPLLVRCYLRCY